MFQEKKGPWVSFRLSLQWLRHLSPPATFYSCKKYYFAPRLQSRLVEVLQTERRAGAQCIYYCNIYIIIYIYIIHIYNYIYIIHMYTYIFYYIYSIYYIIHIYIFYYITYIYMCMYHQAIKTRVLFGRRLSKQHIWGAFWNGNQRSWQKSCRLGRFSNIPLERTPETRNQAVYV